ncbi:MAG: hypothetical protein V3V20_05135 [Algisphaera sp.]
MKTSFSELDAILRGDATQLSSLQRGEIPVSARRMVGMVVVLGLLFGLCMGSFALIRHFAGNDGASAHPTSEAWSQLFGSALKIPLLFLLTLAVTLPSLYVFNAIAGSRLRPRAVIRLLTAMLAVMLAVIASLGPIVAFFAVSTTSYPFMKLLNVGVCAVGGVLGLAFLLRTMHRIVLVQNTSDTLQADAQTDSDSENQVAALDAMGPTERRARSIFTIWLFVFSLVGAQMAWVLRPFIGDPNLPFQWLRNRESNFFVDVFAAIYQLLGG